MTNEHSAPPRLGKRRLITLGYRRRSTGMLLRPRKHPRSADEPVSPAEIAESLFAMGLMAWMIAPVSFLWAPPLWVISLMSPVERPAPAPARAQLAAPVRTEHVTPAIAQQPPAPALATPVPAAPPALPRTARPPRPRPRPRRKEPR
jgi:hypothetical protein